MARCVVPRDSDWPDPGRDAAKVEEVSVKVEGPFAEGAGRAEGRELE